jgi:hypothetical protein
MTLRRGERGGAGSVQVDLVPFSGLNDVSELLAGFVGSRRRLSRTLKWSISEAREFAGSGRVSTYVGVAPDDSFAVRRATVRGSG